MKNRLQQLQSSRRFRMISLVIIVLFVLAGIFYYLKTENRVSIEDSLIQAPVTTISPTTPGILTQVYVTEGQTVHKGQALAIVGSDTLQAYTDGIIISTDKQIGGSVSVQTPVIQMIDPTNMRVDGTLDENKGLNQISVGQPVAFTVDALPGQTFWGYVDEIAPSAKQTQAAFSISSERPTQQFDVYARFDASSQPQIKNGMSAKMTVYTKD